MKKLSIGHSQYSTYGHCKINQFKAASQENSRGGKQLCRHSWIPPRTVLTMWSCSLACAGAGADSARSAASNSAAAQDAALKPPLPPRRSEASIAIPIQSVDLSGFVGKPGVLQSGFPPGLFLFFCALSLFLSVFLLFSF